MKQKYILNWIEEMSRDEFDFFIKILEKKVSLTDEEIYKLREKYSLKEYELSTNSIEGNYSENNKWVDELYKVELNKINYVIQNENLLKEIKGLKCILFGATGTGKTSFVQEVIALNPEFEFINISWHDIVSAKMGQTQINLMKLAYDLNSDDKFKIIFLDELDSLITSRNEKNDLSEYSRIVGTFIKFLDELSWKVVFISSTNLIEKIDLAIMRRFNMKIESKMINFDKFCDLINETISFNLSTQEIGLLNRVFDNDFAFSEVNQFINEYKIDSQLFKIKFKWAYLFLKLKGDKTKLERLSKNREEQLEYEVRKNGNI